ncbi:hypothetical protein [Candidatus Rickettsiella viridis]|nr:hypothetical protein [Candidatus Rickettsiella viridis]
MPTETSKEMLSPKEIEKLAFLLKKDVRELEEMRLEAVKQELLNQKQLTKEEGDLCEIDSLITKLTTFDERDWKISFESERNPEKIYSSIIVDDDNNCPMLLELNGDKAQQQDTLSKLVNAYREITGKDPQTKTYKNAEELPEELKPLLANKPFPLTVMVLSLDNLEQFNKFNKIINSLADEGKIKITDITPQNAPEAQEENANRPTFRP